MTVTLSEVLAAARLHLAPLAGESAGYLVLAVADQMLGAPRAASPEGILLAEDGTARIAEGGAVSSEQAEADLRRLLDALLMTASAASAALFRASRRPAGAGLEALVHEIEAALIPVNRGAARRALSRLARETLRAKTRGELDAAMAPPAFEPPQPAPVPAAPAPEAEPEPELELSVEVVIEDETDDDEPTRALPLPDGPPEPDPEDSGEAETRPEPAVLRASLRPPGAPIEIQPLPTPRIGSFLTDPAPVVGEARPNGEGPASEVDVTDPMPEIAEESPIAAATEASPEPLQRPKSDVDALLATFSVSEQRPDADLRRTLKEIAGVDLTPGSAPVESR